MASLFYKVLGKSLQDARIERSLTQLDVADRIGVARSSVANWENGLRVIYTDDLFKYCDILNIDPNEIIKDARKYLYKK